MAHGFLSYQDTRGEVDYLGGIVNAVKNYLDDREKKEQVADMVAAKIEVENKETAALEAGKSAPRLPMGAQKMLTGGSYSKLVGRNPKALPGAVATNPQVRGGAITRMGFGGKRIKPEGFVGDQVIDISATPINDSNQIVQAIDRLTFVSMNLLSATKEQTAIAQRQQLFFEKLVRKDKAALEEEELERRRTVSGNSPYKKLKSLPPAGGSSSGNLARNLISGGRLGANTKGAKAAAKGTQTALGAAGGALSKSGLKAPGKLLQSAGASAGKLLSGAPAKITGDVITDKSVLSAAQKLLPAKIIQSGGATIISNAGDGFDKLMEAMDALDADEFASRQLAQGTENALLATAMGTKGDVPISQLDGMKTFTNLADSGLGPEEAEDAWKFLYGEDEWKRLVGNKADMPIEKALKGTVAEEMAEQGIKAASKSGAKALGKSFLKKLPVIAGIAGIAFGIQRALEGDFLGAGLEITSGVLGATGVGAGLSFGIDGFLLARDLGMMPMAKGGILTRPTPVVAGEAGAEGFFPLEGSRGKKTFEMFGNAFVDAQKSRIREVAKIQSAGLEEFARKKDNGFFSWLFGGGKNNDNPPSPSNTGNGRAWWDPLGLFTGKNNGAESRTPMVGPPPPLPPITGTDSVSMARSLIVDKEGFEETPYWDVNAYRAGYGSDTYTLADGTVKKVQQGVNITRADADRDIDRRISTEFMPEARRAVGPDIWDKLPAAAQAALTSIAYNYGSVPGRVTRVAKSTNGNIEAIASAVEGLKGDDKGINAGRRQHEADMIRSSAGQAAASLTPPPAIGDQSSVSPAAAETGNPLSVASQQVATAAFTPQAAPIIQNFYGSEGSKNNDGNMPATVAFGISSRDTGTDPFAEFRIRSLV